MSLSTDVGTIFNQQIFGLYVVDNANSHHSVDTNGDMHKRS